ncbi:MAG: gliding motility-associated C-terminal domain-containing protein [Bacteroidia bacterium]|nr:gliding motility-associated C-terminal domain-containing protein [Bacteroidia bacterium]
MQCIIIVWGLLSFTSFKLYSQESIVKDPDFTMYDSSYYPYAPIDFKNLYHWFNPITSVSSPDFLCNCPYGGSLINSNKTGIALYLSQQSKWKNAREYAGTHLKKILKRDKIYYINVSFSIDPRSTFAINRIGILFTSDSIHQDFPIDSNTVINRTPQLEADSNVFYVNDIEFSRYWYELNKVFKPTESNLEFLYIGNFYTDEKTDTITKPKLPNTSYFHIHGGNYSFDYVDIIEVNPNYNLVVNDTVLCQGQSLMLSTASAYTGHTYKWYTKDGVISNKLNATVRPAQTTTYYLYTTDNYHAVCDCNPPVLDSVTVTVINYNVMGVNATAYERNLCSGDTVTLGLQPQSGYTYFWQPNTYLTSNTVANPVLTLPWLLPNDTLVYNVTLTNPQGQSCVLKNNLAFKIITQYCPDSLVPSVYIPNVFTPNNDGKNDKLKLSVTNTISLQATIYNRWGINISGFSGINGFWDGTTTSGEPAPNGIYYITVTLYGMDSKMYFYSGYIHLQRE